MSQISSIEGTISVKTVQGVRILREFFCLWINRDDAELTDYSLVFGGNCVNAGNQIEPCLANLLAEGELDDVSLTETLPGETFEYTMKDGRPHCQCDSDTEDTSRSWYILNRSREYE